MKKIFALILMASATISSYSQDKAVNGTLFRKKLIRNHSGQCSLIHIPTGAAGKRWIEHLLTPIARFSTPVTIRQVDAEKSIRLPPDLYK
jgi:hypothetical protein